MPVAKIKTTELKITIGHEEVTVKGKPCDKYTYFIDRYGTQCVATLTILRGPTAKLFVRPCDDGFLITNDYHQATAETLRWVGDVYKLIATHVTIYQDMRRLPPALEYAPEIPLDEEPEEVPEPVREPAGKWGDAPGDHPKIVEKESDVKFPIVSWAGRMGGVGTVLVGDAQFNKYRTLHNHACILGEDLMRPDTRPYARGKGKFYAAVRAHVEKAMQDSDDFYINTLQFMTTTGALRDQTALPISAPHDVVLGVLLLVRATVNELLDLPEWEKFKASYEPLDAP